MNILLFSKKRIKKVVRPGKDQLAGTYNWTLILTGLLLSMTNTAMKQFKNLIPFIAAIGVFFLANNSPMWKQINLKPSVEEEIKPIPVKEFK